MRLSLFGTLRNLSLAAILPLAAHAAIPTSVTTRNYFGTLVFNRAVAVAAVPGMDSTFVVGEQWLNAPMTTGQASLVRSVGGTWTKTVFDTVTLSGIATANREMGLLDIAFHPNYAQNRKYYLAYTPSYTQGGNPPARLLVVERVADQTLLQRDAAVASKILLNVTQSGNNQKGGHLEFGPADGYLYVGLGDGGGNGDPSNMAQNADSLQGKILRINVNAVDAGKAYAVPADNPFVGQAGKPEVWVKGVRNPWRFTIHPVRNELWVGDVGTDIQDEVTLAPKGGNLGWNVREGTLCFPSTITSCASAGLTAPLYTRTAQSLIGGVFFLGEASGQFNDTYIFGNSGNGFIFAMRIANGAIVDQPVQIGTATNVSSFGKDNRGRILAARVGTSGTGFSITANTGTVQVLESPDMVLLPPVALRHAVRGARAGKAIAWSDLVRNPHLYEIQTLDGRRVAHIPSGAFLAARKGSAEPARILSRVWE
jgi:glucose/arabinose dehydrogenase